MKLSDCGLRHISNGPACRHSSLIYFVQRKGNRAQ